MSIHHNHAHQERGAAHLVLVLAFVVALVGVLGLLGYNAWQKQSANAGDESTVGKAMPSLRIAPTEFNMNYTDPSTLKVVDDNGTQALRIAAPSGGYSFSARAEYEYYSGAPDGTSEFLEKIRNFHYAAAGKKVRVCTDLRVNRAIRVPKGLTASHASLSLNFTVKGKDYWGFDIKPTTQYRQYCKTVMFANKAWMDGIYVEEKHSAVAVISNFGHYPEQPLFVKAVTMKVVR